MSGFKEFARFDAIGLAELIRRKEVSPEEVCEEAIGRIERLNPKINAVVTPMYDLARKRLREPLPDGPFAGVPFLLKDIIEEYAGVPLTKGSRAFRNYVPASDSEMVKRYKESGVVVLGKTNTPEFGLMGVTEPELHGPTRNPWSTEHTPGGSSGGSAAAVASGMVPMASGNDGGGSIRIPSSCCALFGLKPTRGRNPTGPRVGELWQGAVVSHVITRTVRDSAAMLDFTQGPESGAPYIIPEPVRAYREEIQREPGSLRIAFNTVSPIGTAVHPECVRAVQETVRLLESLGHKMEEDRPEVDGHALARSYFTLYFGEVAADIRELRTVLCRKPKPADVEPLTWTLGLLGRTFSAGDFVAAVREWGIAGRAMGCFHESYDLYLTPTLAHPPVKIGDLQPTAFERVLMNVVNATGLGLVLKHSGITDEMAKTSLSKMPFTQLANLTGQPAMSVPLHWTPDGLPCGVQFMAPFGDEAVLFRLAAQLEKAKPWSARHCRVWAEP
ncbi:MAG: amidase [Deltaproteobacteria bacterium]|nr:amidase [Deltaproteobacteria bacterium]